MKTETRQGSTSDTSSLKTDTRQGALQHRAHDLPQHRDHGLGHCVASKVQRKVVSLVTLRPLFPSFTGFRSFRSFSFFMFFRSLFSTIPLATFVRAGLLRPPSRRCTHHNRTRVARHSLLSGSRGTSVFRMGTDFPSGCRATGTGSLPYIWTVETPLGVSPVTGTSGTRPRKRRGSIVQDADQSTILNTLAQRPQNTRGKTDNPMTVRQKHICIRLGELVKKIAPSRGKARFRCELAALHRVLQV